MLKPLNHDFVVTLPIRQEVEILPQEPIPKFASYFRVFVENKDSILKNRLDEFVGAVIQNDYIHLFKQEPLEHSHKTKLMVKTLLWWNIF